MIDPSPAEAGAARELLTFQEAAMLLEVSLATLRQMVRKGVVAAEVVGKSRYIRSETLAAYRSRAAAAALVCSADTAAVPVRLDATTPERLGVPEVAALMRMSHETVRQWIRKGHLPAEQRDGKYWVRREQLAAWLEADVALPPQQRRNAAAAAGERPLRARE